MGPDESVRVPLAGSAANATAGTIMVNHRTILARFIFPNPFWLHLRPAAADAGAGCLTSVHNHKAEVGPAGVVGPDGIGVAVGVDGDADEVEQVAVAAEQAPNALPADVAAMHDFGGELSDRPFRRRRKRLLGLPEED